MIGKSAIKASGEGATLKIHLIRLGNIDAS